MPKTNGKPCSYPDCTNLMYARKLCHYHWAELRKHEAENGLIQLCSVENCTKGIHSRGLCATHYRQSLIRKRKSEISKRNDICCEHYPNGLRCSKAAQAVVTHTITKNYFFFCNSCVKDGVKSGKYKFFRKGARGMSGLYEGPIPKVSNCAR